MNKSNFNLEKINCGYENNICKCNELMDSVIYALQMISIGENSKANDKLCNAIGVNKNNFGFYYEEEDEF